jgi:hypothetical protein
MDLLKFIHHGAKLSGADRIAQERSQRAERNRQDVIRKARALWSNALLVDESRGWLSMLEKSTEVLTGLSVVLSLIAFAQAADTSEDDPKVRVIRGALSAIEQSGKAGALITHDLLVAVSSAARTAQEIVKACSDDAIEHAAHYMHALARLEGAA